MADGRSLAVQSVLYGNPADDIVRAGVALANSVKWARADGFVSEWVLHLGDCSPEPVFDDASIAPLREAVEAHAGVLEYTVFGANLGSAAGHNTLAAQSRSDLVLILNPDAQVSPDTVSVLAARVSGRIALAEARQVPLEHPKDFRKYDGDTSWASTACALTTREAFDAVAGFDSETFFLYCDDVDYSWRLRLAGYRVVYEPAAAVFHDKRLTLTGDWPASSAEIYYSAEAAILLAYKYSRPDLVRSIVAQYRAEGSEPVMRAVAEYESRRIGDRLPAQLDPEHKVGQFINGNYAVHRF
ncbi:MAG: glycosyltransferase family 2 protein [Rhodoglobus sp.]|nr:glycosyltransferase family 2 protein [Rhodoglobus sp.]